MEHTVMPESEAPNKPIPAEQVPSAPMPGVPGERRTKMDVKSKKNKPSDNGKKGQEHPAQTKETSGDALTEASSPEDVPANPQKVDGQNDETITFAKAKKGIDAYGNDTFQSKLALGGLFAELFFDNSEEKYRKRRGKNHPFNRFCAMGHLKTVGLCKKSMMTLIRVHFAWDQYPEDKRELVPLGVHEELIKVKDLQTRLQLLDLAIEKGLGCRDMAEEVKKRTANYTKAKKTPRPVKKVHVWLDKAIDMGVDSSMPQEDLDQIEQKAEIFLAMIKKAKTESKAATERLFTNIGNNPDANTAGDNA